MAQEERAADLSTAIGVREQLQKINADAHAILREARAAGDRRTALHALDRIERQLTLAAKLADLLHDAPNVQVAVNVDNGWPQLRSAILTALEDHPDARRDVLNALTEVRS